jgi:hypothetical protein
VYRTVGIDPEQAANAFGEFATLIAKIGTGLDAAFSVGNGVVHDAFVSVDFLRQKGWSDFVSQSQMPVMFVTTNPPGSLKA